MQPEQLPAIAAEATADELPALIGALEAAKAVAWARLAATAQQDQATRPEPLLSLPEVAAALGIPEDRAYDLAREGLLPVVTIGKYKRVRESTLRAFIAASETPATPGRRLRKVV